jgi:hypothetical protein
VTIIAAEPEPPSLALQYCVQAFRKSRYERERAIVRREIDRLQNSGRSDSEEINSLLARNGDLGRLIQALAISEE